MLKRGRDYTPSTDITQNWVGSQVYPYYLYGKGFLISISFSLLIWNLRIIALTVPSSGSFHYAYKASIVFHVVSPCFSHETSWKLVFGLYLSLVFYLQLNILWKHLASVNNCLFGNYSSSSCTLLGMMRQLWKEIKAFSMVGASRKTGWMGQGVYLEQREAAWWKGRQGNGNGEGEPQTSHGEVLIPASSSVHTRPRKQKWRVWTEKWQLGIFLEGSLIANGVSSSSPIYILCSICYY